MGVVITFDPAAWKVAYPEFAAVSDPRAQEFFGQATLYWPNTIASPVTDPAQQTRLFNLLTAHIATLMTKADGSASPANQPVGRVSSATEGSVSVQTELPGDASMNEAWYLQTKYGLMFWQATAQYRTMKYRVAARALAYQPGMLGGRRFWGR